MPEIVIKNFKFGLDRRRSELTSQPGTLYDLTDGHITPGGEVARRKAFVRALLPGDTYGLESTDLGLLTFGSRPASKTTTNRARTSNVATITLGTNHGFVVGDVVTLTGLSGTGYNAASQTITAVAATTISYANVGSNEGTTADTGGTVTLIFPTVGGKQVVYQRLQHPSVTEGATYDAQYHEMTEVKWSYPFLGDAYVSAKFADGRTFLFFDGSLVLQSRNGLVLPGWNTQGDINESLAVNFAANVNAELPEWPVGVTSLATPGLTDSKGRTFHSPLSITFDASITMASTNGLMAHQVTDANGGAAVTPVPGTTTVTISGGGGSSYTLAVKLSLTASVQTTIVDTINWTTSNDATATLITTAINRGFSYHGFSASRIGAVITVTNPIVNSTATGVVGGTYTWDVLTVTAVSDATANGDKTFSSSTASNPGTGQEEFVSFYHAWAVGDSWAMEVVTSADDTVTLGKGRIAGTNFGSGFVHKERVFLPNGSQFNFSAVDDPTLFEQQNVGAGFIGFTSQYGAQDTVQSFADYQGRLATFGRRSIQIWTTDADPAQFILNQTLTNVGTMAPFSVQSLGELDVFFLSDTGVRSLRIRNSSLNAFVNDLGSPIDEIIQAVLASLTDAEKATACSVIEPDSNRYWLFLDDTIYVLSYFPENKIVAWSKYEPKYDTGGAHTITNNNAILRKIWVSPDTSAGAAVPYELAGSASAAIVYPQKYIWSGAASATAPTGSPTEIPDGFVGNIGLNTGVFTFNSVRTAFTPQKFTVHEGRLFVRDANAVYIYGGTDNATFDSTIARVELPWLDDGKPALHKQSQQLDVGITGKWRILAGMDPTSGTLEATLVNGNPTSPNQNQDSSFDLGHVPFSGLGTHIKIKAQSTSDNTGEAKLSCVVFTY